MIPWIALILSIIGIILNARKVIYCWLVWIIANVFWIVHSISVGDYVTTIVWAVFTVSNIYGWRKWYLDSLTIDQKLDRIAREIKKDNLHGED